MSNENTPSPDSAANTGSSRRNFLKLAGLAATTMSAGPLGCSVFQDDPEPAKKNNLPKPKAAESNSRSIDYSKAKATPTICFGCTTHCGVLAWVQDDRVRTISGNPLDKNSQGKVCAKAQGMISYTYYPQRILYPLKRVGPRGSGRWKRISWEDALTEIAAKLKPLRENKTPERFVFHYGRDKTKGFTKRFTNAFGTPHRLNRRSICSSNRRAPLMSFYGRDFEWESQDIARTKFILNFGGNPCEAYQGGMFILTRLQHARVDNGAKLITFEVRPSATASVSDEYYPIYPGTDGLVALAMANVIIDEKLHNQKFWDRWANCSIDEVKANIKSFTVEYASKRSGIKADTIKRLAREFAAAAPHCMTMSNRGSAKHYNGYQGDRGIRLLDVLVGNVGMPGGFCLSNGRGWAKRYGQWDLPKLSQPGPKPGSPKPWLPGTREFEALPKEVQARVKGFPEAWQKRYFGELATPSEYPLSWHWYQMRVGQLVYPYIAEGRQKVDVYMSYTLGAAYGYPEANVARKVLLDESLIPFHVAIDISYGEQAALADIILPEATSLERWDAHGTNSYGLQPYTGIRQPVVKPLGQSRSIQDILADLAKRIGGGMEKFFAFESMEAFYKEWHKNLPISWEEFKRRGIYLDESRELDHQLYERTVPAEELKNAKIDEKSGLVTISNGKKTKTIGIKMGDKIVRGFPTPTRKIQVKDPVFPLAAKSVGIPETDPLADPLPTWFEIPGHEKISNEQYIFTTFKWNVHTQGRSGHWKYSAEIVHTNPIWMHPETGKQLGLKTGDEVELVVYRPKGRTYRGEKTEVVGKIKNRVRLIQGMHPKVVACSHHVGHWEQGPVGNPDGHTKLDQGENKDLESDLNVWWAKSNKGAGHGEFINDALPINPAPLVGGQNWFDNICTIRKV